MSFDAAPVKPFANQILSALPKSERERIKTKLEPFELRYGEIIYEAGDWIDKVYFPDSGIISLLATLGGNSLLEVGIVCEEGVVGLSAFLGTFIGSPVSRVRAVVQGDGFAHVMKTSDFLAECEINTKLSKLLLNYSQLLMMQISQSAVCYRFHKIEERLARWLLTTSDCMLSAEFRITQEFLSHMLGVRREGVTKAAAGLHKQNVIAYSRGNLKIINRKALEEASCACYEIIKEEKILTKSH